MGPIEGYLLIPHELLHIVGYRLVGKRCLYHWGDHRQAYLLIYRKKTRDKTPFDFLFWPIVADDPKRVQTLALIVMVCVIIFYGIYLLLKIP
jgi:hypothetical protein